MATVTVDVDVDVDLRDIHIDDLLLEVVDRLKASPRSGEYPTEDAQRDGMDMLVKAFDLPLGLREMIDICLRGEMTLTEEYSLLEWCNRRRKGLEPMPETEDSLD